MLTETISGKCPCCGYNKLLQRYGSMGYYQLDGCPKCGFGYGTNHHDEPAFGIEAWLDYGIHILSMMHLSENNNSQGENNNSQEEYDKWYNELNALPLEEKRKLVFELVDKLERSDDVETTVFKYEQEDIDKHKALNIEIL